MIKRITFAGMMLCILLAACTNSRSPQQIKDRLADQILHASDNMERLYLLRQGQYVRYQFPNRDTTAMRKWKVNDGEDSLIMVTKKLGNKNKNGYWTLNYLFGTNLPNTPLLKYLDKFERVSRDTFTVTQYLCQEDLTLQDIIDDRLLDKIDLEVYKSTENLPIYTIVKVNNTQFKFDADLKPYNYAKDSTQTYLQSSGTYNLEANIETGTFYDNLERPTLINNNYDKRLMDLDLNAILKAKASEE